MSGIFRMERLDDDFILERIDAEPRRSAELTGWERVVFELDEELPPLTDD